MHKILKKKAPHHLIYIYLIIKMFNFYLTFTFICLGYKVLAQDGIHLNQLTLYLDFNYTNQSVDIELRNKNIISIDPTTFNGFNNLTILNLNYNNILK